MRRAIATLVVAFLAWLVLPAPVTAVAQAQHCAAVHLYDGQLHSARLTTSSPERGPPNVSSGYTTYDAVDAWSRGALPRLDAATGRPIYGYDDLARFVRSAHRSHGVEGPSRGGAAGVRLDRRLPVAAETADEIAAAGSKVGPTTAHGAERIAGAGATRGGVLSEDQILLVRGYGQPLTQADGAAVRVLQNEAGRFDVVVDGSRGLITSFSNLSQKSLERLATRYGWN